MKIVRVQVNDSFGQLRVPFWVSAWRRGRREPDTDFISLADSASSALRLSDEDAVALALIMLDRHMRSGTITNSFVEVEEES